MNHSLNESAWPSNIPMLGDELPEVGLSSSLQGYKFMLDPSPITAAYTPHNGQPVLISPDLLIDREPRQTRSKKFRSIIALGNVQQSGGVGIPRLSIAQEGRPSPIKRMDTRESLISHSSRSASRERFEDSNIQAPMAFMRKIDAPLVNNPLFSTYNERRSLISQTSQENFEPPNYQRQEKRMPAPPIESNHILNESLIPPVSEDSSFMIDDSRSEKPAINLGIFSSKKTILSNNQPSIQSDNRSRGFLDRETSRMIMDMSQGQLVPIDDLPSTREVMPAQQQRAQLFVGSETDSMHPSLSMRTANRPIGSSQPQTNTAPNIMPQNFMLSMPSRNL